VLIMGLATQMIAWPDELCEGLARSGLFVVRFDHRDVGESTRPRNLTPPRQPCAHAAPTTTSARESLATCNVRRS
jgi:alpha-beta hydrolase superfamily lysophospholipase